MMGMAARPFLGLLLGGAGGAVYWLATDFVFNPLSDPERMIRHQSPVVNLAEGALLGLFIGASLGIADALGNGARALLKSLALRGGIAGFVAGAVAWNVANNVYSALGGNPEVFGPTMSSYLLQIAIRATSWTVLGCLLGGLTGLLAGGWTRCRNGAVGGAIGGFLGGLFFNPLSHNIVPALFGLGQADRIGRLVGWILLGAFVGFFTALVQILMKSAWVFVIYGRNEGQEIILEKPVTHIGRNELAEIPIFGDRLLAANHAEIRLENGRYHLVDGGSVVGTSVNGQKVAEPVVLKDSDLIQLGNTQVVFYERATAGPMRRQVDLATAAPAAPPIVPSGTCAFCGEIKDPVTGACACSVDNAQLPPAASDGRPVGGMAPAPSGYSPFESPQPGAAGSGGLRLVAVAGAHSGESFAVFGQRMEIGRDAGAAIPLVRDTTVSRRHAELVQQGNDWILTDGGSSNGTFVNGVRVSSQPVRPGDEVAFGTARFRVESG